MLWYRLRLTLDMIKFEHSIFALPFALTGALLAFRQNGFDSRGIGDAEQVSVADCKNNEVAGIFRGKFCTCEVMFGREVVF